jgi:hypothetical protein
MADVLLDMAVSLGGFVAGRGGGDAGLYDWYFNPSEVSRPVIEDLVATTGAIVMGRGAFVTGEEADGWQDTPYAVPHFVITHQAPLPVPGRTVDCGAAPLQLARNPSGVHGVRGLDRGGEVQPREGQ